MHNIFKNLTTQLDHLAKAIKYSLLGIKCAFSNGLAFRQEAIISLFVLPAGIFLGKSNVERALLTGSWLFVIVVELINSAIETTVDRVSLEHNDLSGRAKDLGSASVLCAIVLAVFVWILVLFG